MSLLASLLLLLLSTMRELFFLGAAALVLIPAPTSGFSVGLCPGFGQRSAVSLQHCPTLGHGIVSLTLGRARRGAEGRAGVQMMAKNMPRNIKETVGQLRESLQQGLSGRNRLVVPLQKKIPMLMEEAWTRAHKHTQQSRGRPPLRRKAASVQRCAGSSYRGVFSCDDFGALESLRKCYNVAF